MNRIAITALLLSLAGPLLLAQTKTGTTVGQFTLIDPSARFAAMGGAGGASWGESMAGYYNPGALGALDHSDLQFTHNAWFASIALNSAAAAFPLGEFGAAGLFMTQLSSGDINVTTVEQPGGTGERYSVNDLLIGVAFGLRITDRFSAGIQVNYVNERIWHSSLSNFGVNIGTLYQLSADGLRIGASLVNFGTRSQYSGTDLQIRYDFDPSRYGDNSSIPGELITDEYSLPIVFRVGLSYPWKIDESNTLNAAIDALHPSDNSECVDVGGEWTFRQTFALRVGYANLFQVDSEWGLTAGGGIMVDAFGYDLRFDYGWAAHKRLGSVQRITLGLGL